MRQKKASPQTSIPKRLRIIKDREERREDKQTNENAVYAGKRTNETRGFRKKIGECVELSNTSSRAA